MKRFTIAAVATMLVAACGGGDDGGAAPSPAPAPAAPPAAAPTAAPSAGASAADWVTVDESARTVTINLIAGETDANNRWNFNGYANGEATVVVPEGFTVTVNFENVDPVNFHSVAVIDLPSGQYPAMFDGVEPTFSGATSSNPTSMTESTPGGGSESFTFTASAAGQYALVCLIPAHAVTGMWIGFDVSGSGESGVRM